MSDYTRILQSPLQYPSDHTTSFGTFKIKKVFSYLIIQIMRAGLNRKFIRIAAKNYIQQSTLFSNYSSQIKFLYSSIILAIKFKLCKGTYIKMCVHCLVYNQLTYLHDFYICLAAVSPRHR